MKNSPTNQDQIDTVKLSYQPIEISELVGVPLSEIRHEIETGRLQATHGSDGSLHVSRADLQTWWRHERGGGNLFERDATPH